MYLLMQGRKWLPKSGGATWYVMNFETIQRNFIKKILLTSYNRWWRHFSFLYFPLIKLKFHKLWVATFFNFVSEVCLHFLDSCSLHSQFLEAAGPISFFNSQLSWPVFRRAATSALDNLILKTKFLRNQEFAKIMNHDKILMKDEVFW